MKLHRIYGIILRFMLLFRRSFDRMTDVFYWPTVDLLLWGLTSQYFKEFTPDSNKVLLMIITGILFWIIAWRGQYEISVNMLEDLWNENFINIFVSPIKFNEWVVSFLIIGVLKGILSLAFASLMAFILYKVHIFDYGFYLLPFLFSLLLTGWWVGFFVGGLILRFGTRLQTFAWTMVAVLSPFAAIYYPVSILPGWAQFVAKFVPPSYIFEAARSILYTGHFDLMNLLYSFGLNILYLFLGYLFLRNGFIKLMKKGMVHLY